MGRQRDRSRVQEARIAWTAILLSVIAIALTVAYFLANFVFRTVQTYAG